MSARLLLACALLVKRLSKVDHEIGVSAGGPVIGGNRNDWARGSAPN